MKIKKIISVLTTAAILATSLPMQSFAEGETVEPVKNGDRWAFRQAYVDMTRIVNSDGTYSFPKMELTEKIDIYTFLHNLLNLETISDGSNIPGYPGQLTLYQQPMFINLPPDLINTVGPEDIEIYTTFSNPGSGFKGRLSDEQLERLYTRNDSWTNGKEPNANTYRNGDSTNAISIPELSRYSAKTFDISTPVLYDKDHNVVPNGQKGGAYFKFMISGAVETINPGDENDDKKIKGYGLRTDERKQLELTDAIRGFIEAGMLYPTEMEPKKRDYSKPPTSHFTIEKFNQNLQTAMELQLTGNGLFKDLVQNITETDNMIYGAAFDLATQFTNIDAVKCQEAASGELVTKYQELGNIQSTWATAKEGLIPYFEEVLLSQNEEANNMYSNSVQRDFMNMMIESFTDPKPGFPIFHELMTGLSNGSYIKHKVDSNGDMIYDSKGNSIIERDVDGSPIYQDNFTDAFANVVKSGGMETSIYFAFEYELSTLYSSFAGLNNKQIEAKLQEWYDSLYDPATNTLSAKMTAIFKGLTYVSKLQAVAPPESYRTYFPIAIRLKVADELNLAATDLVVNPNGCVDWKAEMLEGSGDIVTNGEIRAYDKMTGDVVERAKLSGITFSPTNKVATGQVCMDPNIDYVYEFEINPDPRTHTEKTYDDNIFARPPLDIEASALTCIPSADEKTLEVHWLANLVGEYTGVTSVEMLIKNSGDGTVLAHDTIPNLTFNDEGYISGDYTFNVGNSIPPQSVNIIFRVNLPGGNPGNQPNNEINYTNNDLTISTVIGTVPPLPDITAKCETMSDKDGSERTITKVERRSWNDLDSGRVLGWSTKTYNTDSCPVQVNKKTWYLDGSLSKQTQDHTKYVSCVRKCGRYNKKGKCRDVYYQVTERVSAVVEFKAKVTGHTPILWNNRFLDRDWIRAGYGVNIGGEISVKTDYDKNLNPIMATYRPKDNVSNINVDLLPEHDSDTFSVDTTNNGGLKIISSSGSAASGNYFFQYQSTSRPLYDTGGDQHGTTNQRYINVQRADGPYTVWYLVVFPEFSGYASNGNQYVLGSCRSKSIRVEGTMYDDYYVHPADEGDQPK